MEFQLHISPSNEYSRLIFFRIDWFDLLAIPGTLKSLFQHHSSKASILRHSAFFMIQLSHPNMTTGKTIALTIRTFVGKVMPTSSVIFGAQEEKEKGPEKIFEEIIVETPVIAETPILWPPEVKD